MGRRNTKGKRISQLRRSKTSQGRMQPSLGESLSLYLRGNEAGEPIDYSIYDKLLVDAPRYRGSLKAYKAYLISGNIILEQDIDTSSGIRYDGLTEPDITLYRQTLNFFDLTNPPIQPTGASGTGAWGTGASGTGPYGTLPSGTGPSGTGAGGTGASGTGLRGTHPSGTGPNGTYPSGTGPDGTGPSGTSPGNETGTGLSGTGPSGTYPSGTGPSGTGASGTGISGTGPNGTYPSGTGPSGTQPNGTGPDGTGPSGTSPGNETGTGPSGTGPSGTGPNGTGPSGTGLQGTHPSGTGPSGTGPNGTGPSGTQPSGTGLSGTGACLTGPSGTKPSDITGQCDLRFSKFSDGPRGVAGEDTQVGVLTDSSGREYIQVKNSRVSNTAGGSSISDLRTVYLYAGDSGSTPTYTGSSWPYVIIEGDVKVESEVTATITKGANDILLINGKPVYQYAGEANEEGVEGIGNDWTASSSDGSSENNSPAAGEVTPAHKYEIGVIYDKTGQAPFTNIGVSIKVARLAPNILYYYDHCQKGATGKIIVKDFNKVQISDDSVGLPSPYSNNPGKLTHIDSNDQGDFAQGAWGDGSFIYLANYTGGLHSYSVDGAGNLTHIDSDDQGDLAYGVWGDGNYVYLANGAGGLHSYSVDGSGNLTHIDSDDPGGGEAYNVWGDGNFIYLANTLGGLHTYSVDGSGNLTHIDSDDQGDQAYGVWGDGTFIYLANYTGGLHTYSVDGSGNLTHIDSDDQGDWATDVWGDGNYIYLANGAGGLHSYSVDGAGNLTHIDSDVPGSGDWDIGYGVWGDGNYVYLANHEGGLHTYSVDGAGNLTHIDSDDQGDHAKSVWGDGDFIYLANWGGGLHSYSVQDSWQRSYSFRKDKAIILPRVPYNKSEDLVFGEANKQFSFGFWAKLNETGIAFGEDQCVFDFSSLRGYFTNSGTKFIVSGLQEQVCQEGREIRDAEGNTHGPEGAYGLHPSREANWILESKDGTLGQSSSEGLASPPWPDRSYGITATNLEAIPQLQTTGWNHYAISRNQEEFTLYVNGKRNDSVNASITSQQTLSFKHPASSSIYNTAFSTLGCSRKIEHFLNGKIDDFLIYNIDYYPRFGFTPERSFSSGDFPRRERSSFKAGLQAQFNKNIDPYHAERVVFPEDGAPGCGIYNQARRTERDERRLLYSRPRKYSLLPSPFDKNR